MLCKESEGVREEKLYVQSREEKVTEKLANGRIKPAPLSHAAYDMARPTIVNPFAAVIAHAAGSPAGQERLLPAGGHLCIQKGLWGTGSGFRLGSCDRYIS